MMSFVLRTGRMNISQIILAKKEDLTYCGHYRGIMLLSVPGRILSKIPLNRIKKKVNEKLRPNQAGFRPNHSTIDQITTLKNHH